KKASRFFSETNAKQPAVSVDGPFALHNVDVLTNIDLAAMLEFHRERDALATLAVQHRETSRPLSFSDRGQLLGRAADGAFTSPGFQPAAFSGVHVISPRLLPLLTESGAFSVIDSYIRLAADGHKILAFPADQYYWRDLGRPADLAQAAQDLSQGLI